MEALVFTPTSLFQMSNFSITEEWFEDFQLPENSRSLKRVEIQNRIFIIERELSDELSPIIVINLAGPHKVFPQYDAVQAFERMITVARATFTRSVRIPTSWQPYHDHSLLSVYAHPKAKSSWTRINFDLRPNNEEGLFIYAISHSSEKFSEIQRDIESYRSARESLVDAILADTVPAPTKSAHGIVLSERLPQGFVQGASIEQWYETKLTKDQRQFVDKPYDGPVRLRGAAGTGKTLSLVIKALRDGSNFEREAKSRKFAFITHSVASVDLVSSIAESLDTAGLVAGTGKYCKLELRTLYDLAHEHLRFALDDLSPLSLDGREGRRLQFELIQGVLKEMYGSRVLRAQFDELPDDFTNRWKRSAESEDSKFVTEIMNEFASVLDADGIRAGEERAEKYAKGSLQRAAWLMPLPTELHRRFMLEIHRRYRHLLAEMNTLSVDQMVADFNAFLDSNRWDHVRVRQGYDALFVDELHLFTSIERQILHKLIRQSADDQGRPMRPPIFMAYDLKQSPNDAFVQMEESGSQIFSATSRLQGSDLIKLDQVFRYTPQIAEFLADLDASFPAIDIPGEWEAYSGLAQQEHGEKPTLTIFKDEVSLFRSVLDSATSEARRVAGGGRRVAVLCPTEEVFDRYLRAAEGQYQGKIFPITNREPSSELRHAGKKFIFSMPEYVAGLQFETVYLIHVDSADAPIDASLGLRRRFISNVYLGSSRAESSLRISACISRGGPSHILSMALERGSLVTID